MVVEKIEDFAFLVHKLLRSDRDVIMAVGGFTGEGKSTFTTKLQKEYAKISSTKWSFNNMTWSRKEMMKWIDGEKDKEGNRNGQVEEFTAILPDELFTMFYRRNWYEEGQIGAIATFNMCRDRHLFVAGNIPNFWDLDVSFTKRVRFYAYIPERGIAWIFEQENNPFSNDPWNVSENKKQFRKKKKPYGLPNFVCEIRYDDWDKEEKKEYYKIRNKKRLEAIEESKNNSKAEKYKDVKKQRDELIKAWYNDRKYIAELIKKKKSITEYKRAITNEDIAEIINLSKEAVRLVIIGER